MMTKVDKEKCIGCGTCPAIAGDVFRLGDDGKAEAIPAVDLTGKEDAVRQAREACPVQAISVE